MNTCGNDSKNKHKEKTQLINQSSNDSIGSDIFIILIKGGHWSRNRLNDK